MSFVRRSASFASVSREESDKAKFVRRSASFAEHEFFYDVEDMHVLKAGGLPKLAEMGGVQGLAAAFRTSLTTGLYKDEVEAKFVDRITKYVRFVFVLNIFTQKLICCDLCSLRFYALSNLSSLSVWVSECLCLFFCPPLLALTPSFVFVSLLLVSFHLLQCTS